MRAKTAPARVKTVSQKGEDLPAGEFRALVSVFGTVDSVGDVVMPGAFAKSLAGYAEKDAQIPIVWSHDWNDPFSHIGHATSATESELGLELTGQLDIEDNPKAMQVYRLLKNGRVRDFSFAYEVLDSMTGERDGKSITELRELEIYEAGPTLIGAHRDTELLDIKAGEHAGQRIAKDPPPKPGKSEPEHYVYIDGEQIKTLAEMVDASVAAAIGAKAGRVLSKADEAKIAQIADLATELLTSVRKSSEGNDETGKATPAQPATTEEPPAEAKVNAPARPGTAAADRLRTDLELLGLEITDDERSG